MSKYQFDTSDYVGNFASQYGRKELLRRSVFDSYIDIPFEEYKFMACTGYEEYLVNIYGKNIWNFQARIRENGHIQIPHIGFDLDLMREK